jgi:hypothetical protein
MLVFLKNTVEQINNETRQGAAPVARVTQAAAPEGSEITQDTSVPANVDAVTSGTQPIARYFAAQMAPRPKDQKND